MERRKGGVGEAEEGGEESEGETYETRGRGSGLTVDIGDTERRLAENLEAVLRMEVEGGSEKG